MKAELRCAQISVPKVIDRVLGLTHEALVSRGEHQKHLVSAEKKIAKVNEQYNELKEKLLDAKFKPLVVADLEKKVTDADGKA